MSRRKQVLNDEDYAAKQVSEDRIARRKHERKMRRRRLVSKLIKVSLVVLLVFVVYKLDKSAMSRVSSIKISGNSIISNEEILQGLNIAEGDRLLFTHAFFKERKAKNIPGLESIDVNVYYTKGYVSLDVKEVTAVGYTTEPLRLYYEDGSFKDLSQDQSNLLLGLPLLVGFSDETITPKMLNYLGALDSESFSSISEIHLNPQSYDPLAMKLYMSEHYLVYVNIETLPMMYMYATLLSGADEGKNCIDLNEYGPDDESVIANIRACSENEY